MAAKPRALPHNLGIVSRYYRATEALDEPTVVIPIRPPDDEHHDYRVLVYAVCLSGAVMAAILYAVFGA